MWTGLRRILVYFVLTLALFVCVYASRIFFAPRIVEWLMPEPSLLRIGVAAIVGGLLPALPFGVAYGLLAARPVAWKALGIAAGASVIELSLATWTLPLWLSFRTWWALPLVCLTLVIFFPAAAWAPRGCGARVSHRHEGRQ